MSELNVLALTIVLRTVATCFAIFAAAYLAFYEKDGWGWMIFLAICIGSTSYKYTND
jgi:ABC-type phosphate transport system permease subunit